MVCMGACKIMSKFVSTCGLLIGLFGISYGEFSKFNLPPPSSLTAFQSKDLLTEMNASFNALSAHGTNAYTFATLATDTNLWIHSVRPSCLGISQPPGFLNVLFAPDWVLCAAHTSKTWGSETHLFILDSNNVAYAIPYSGTNYTLGDMCICQLVSNAPASCVVPWVLPPDWMDYFAGGVPTNMPAFWFHKNQGRVEALRFNNGYTLQTRGPSMATEAYLPDVNSSQRGGSQVLSFATSGDSGDPAFTVIDGKLVLPGVMNGFPSMCGVSDAPFVDFLRAHNVKVNVVDLSRYKKIIKQ